MKETRTFRFYWSDGKVEEGKGVDIDDALSKAGYSKGAMIRLNRYIEIETGKTVQVN
jgi:hypothetical protein